MRHSLRLRRGLTGRGVALALAAAALLAGLSVAAGGAVRPRPQAVPQAGPQPSARSLAGAPGRVSNQALAAGMRLLDEAVRAARRTSYEGLQVISWQTAGRLGWLAPRAGRITVEVWHRQGAGTLSRVTAPAGGTWSDLTDNGPGSPADGMLGLTPALIGLLGTHYAVLSTGTGSVSGRPARIVEVVRADGSVAALFWLDRVTALPLRREIFDDSAHLISDDGFDQLKLGERAAAARAPAAAPSAPAAVPGTPAAVPGPPAGVAGTSAGAATASAGLPTAPARAAATSAASGTAGPAVFRPWAGRLRAARLAALRAEGWPVPRLLPGGLTLFDASQAATSTGRVVDLAYSDGLSVVSLFVQHGRLPAALPGWRAADLDGSRLYVRDPGEPDLTWSAGGFVFTMVAAAPAPTVAAAVDALPHQAEPGVWGRMKRGMLRLLSWVNPFR